MPKRKASTSTPVNDENDSQVEKQTTAIVPNGDLYMVFNSNDSESKRLLVSRYILCLSSKVLDAMLGDSSQFQEATNPTLSHDGICEVAFNDDDFPAMLMIMNILHLQHDRVPPHISFTQLSETARICDKYDLVRSVGLWPATWSQQYFDRIEDKSFHHWLLIASVFRLKEAFTRVTRHLILNSNLIVNTEELLTADGWPFTEGVPCIVIDEILVARAGIVYEVQAFIWGRLQKLQFTVIGQRSCGPRDGHGHERGDSEREHCDTWNLGCLVRHFPNMNNPNGTRGRHCGNVMAIMNKVDAMDTFQRRSSDMSSKGYIRSHILDTACNYLPFGMRVLVSSVEGLHLKD